MPKPVNPHLRIHLDLLRPQSNPEKLLIKLLHWLLSTGRFIFIFVEALVLIAFIARFKFDADLASKKEAIEQQIPYIESLKPFEILIRQTQLKLSTIDNLKTNSLDFSEVLKKIAEQAPQGVKILTLNLIRNVDKATIQITGQVQNNIDLASFISGLKGEASFSDVTLTSISLEQGIINFAINAQTNSQKGKSL